MSLHQTAIFAAGCFWGVQDYFDHIPGVVRTEVGYTGGHAEEPTYEQVCSRATGHAEAVLVTFDPSVVNYEKLVRHFFRLHDPTQLNRQGPDEGDNYRSAIFYTDDQQRAEAQAIKDELNVSQYDGKIMTEITEAGKWWPAEDYHQKYAERTGRGVCHVAFKPI